MEEDSEDFRGITGRELLLSLSRFGAAFVTDRLGLGGDEYDREEDDDNEADYVEGAEAMEEEREAVPAAVASSPASCSFLFPGRSFTGQQSLSSPQRPQEDWAVTATIYSCDLARGRVTGSMVAQNSPLAKRPIVTYFEGEIIDNINHTFWTGCKWGTCPSRETDVRYWSRCPGFTSSLRAAIVHNNGRAQQLSSCTHVFMRWKECFFVDVPQDCPLTITGFYYLSLDRQTGSIGGYYHDSRSAPLQVLQLQPVEVLGGSSGSCGTGNDLPRSGFGGPAGAVTGPWRGLSAGGTADDSEPPAGMAFGAYRFC
ncbi:hypothetical protein VaNZ11_016819 [Volvox africanus]|uniref:Uncharacterized protein n=1 Tax=Volvox africanus TaxID=51714 RepID=A0ABQ5SP51_9CHLO|nr:hypothetical protein VaNZ11_016819 [Volvox africanus]